MAKKTPKKAAKNTPKKIKAVKKAIKKTAKKTGTAKFISSKRKSKGTYAKAKFARNSSDLTSTKAGSEREIGLIETIKNMLVGGATLQEIASALGITMHYATNLAMRIAKQVRSEQVYKKGRTSPEGDPPPWH